MAKKEAAVARPRSIVTPEEFVALWQGGESLVEIGEKYDLGQKSAQQRAASYRKKGVDLKSFPKGSKPRLDIETLNKIAKKSLKKA